MDQAFIAAESTLHHAEHEQQRVDQLNEQSATLFTSDLQRSLEAAAAAEALAVRIPYPAGIAHAIKNRARVHQARGECAEALALCDDAIGRFAKLGDFETQALVTQRLSHLYMYMGDYPLALETLLRAKTLVDAHGDAVSKAHILFHLGVLHSNSGNPRQAIDCYLRASDLFSSAGNLKSRAVVLNSLCVDYTQLREYDLALQAGEEALRLMLQVDDIFGAGVAQASLGELALGRQEYAAAVEQFKLALTRLAVRGPELHAIEALETRLSLGKAELALGALAAARDTTQGVLDYADANAIQSLVMASSHVMSDICERLGDLAGALHYLKRYIAERERILNETNQRQLQHLKIIHETREVTEEAERQHQLHEQERQKFERIVQLKDEVLHHATHDIKNPLSTVSMALFLLEKEISPENKLAYSTLQRAKESAVKIRDLIASVLDLAKLEAALVLDRDPIDLESSLSALLLGHELHASEKQIDLSLHVPPRLICLCNQTRLEQALNNLISNAIKYTREGGRVQVSAQRAASEVVITVQDDGVGIPDESLPHLFKRFYRVPDSTHMAPGTGIGLSIVKLLVEQHGGTVSVASKVGEGSTFTVRLPQPDEDSALNSDTIPL